MNRVKKVSLDTKDINDLITGLELLQDNLKEIEHDVPFKLARLGKKYLKEMYSRTQKDENVDVSDIDIDVKDYDNHSELIASGDDVLYAEFGTGERGLEDSHPIKGSFSLNDYNSGKTIRDIETLYDSIQNGLASNNEKIREKAKTKQEYIKKFNIKNSYWTYKKDGKKIYTSGIPAGKQVYKTEQFLKNTGMKEILDERVGDVLSKV